MDTQSIVRHRTRGVLHRRRALGALVAGALWLGPTIARADDAPPARDAALADALDAYEHGRYVEARRGFETLYSQSRQPPLLYAIAQTFRKQGNCAQAATLYRRYLATTPPKSERESALANIARCEPAKKSAPPPVKPSETSPANVENPLRADVKPPQPARRSETRSRRSRGLWLLAGTSAALAIAGTYSLSHAHAVRSDFNDQHLDGQGNVVGISRDGARGYERRVGKWSTAGVLLLAGAGAVAATTSYLWLNQEETGETSAGLRIAGRF